jgi:lysophospholipase L1-like esterase
MNTVMRTYLALGDSMSIDDYTGVEGGGAVNQFFRTLEGGWTLDDRTYDGCRMPGVSIGGRGDLVTLTIGGNDLLFNAEAYMRDGLADFAKQHAGLLALVRQDNPHAVVIVGDVYAPAVPLSAAESGRLAEANAIIAANCEGIRAVLAPFHAAFRGRESTHLCLGIEPTLAGAQEIARLFQVAARSAGGRELHVSL